MNKKEECQGCIGFTDEHTCEGHAEFLAIKAAKDKCPNCERLTAEGALLRDVYDTVKEAMKDELEQGHDLHDLTPWWADVEEALAAVAALHAPASGSPTPAKPECTNGWHSDPVEDACPECGVYSQGPADSNQPHDPFDDLIAAGGLPEAQELAATADSKQLHEVALTPEQDRVLNDALRDSVTIVDARPYSSILEERVKILEATLLQQACLIPRETLEAALFEQSVTDDQRPTEDSDV